MPLRLIIADFSSKYEKLIILIVAVLWIFKQT